MFNKEYLDILDQGVDFWNEWRRKNPESIANLQSAQLEGRNLRGIDFSWTYLALANLKDTNLGEANLDNAVLVGADLTAANLYRASAELVWFSGTKLVGAYLKLVNFRSVDCDCDMEGARLDQTIFCGVDLSDAKGLANCVHDGPSFVDYRTLVQSKNVPRIFWRGCGLPDKIKYVPYGSSHYVDIFAPKINQFHSCFISYSSIDQDFAVRIYNDLQAKGARCWFAPHDLPIGSKTWDGIDEAIRTRDKVLLILSESAISSDWVEDEVTKAFAEERRRKELVLFPVRIDDAIIDTTEPWAAKLRDNRNIGDFRHWKDQAPYQAALHRLLRDLTLER